MLGQLTGLLNSLFGSSLPETTNILGSTWVFYLPALFSSGIRSGLLIYIYRQFFTNMPVELEEAAYIDGAGPLKAFWRVMLPNAKPAHLTAILFSIVWYWNDFFYAGTMLSDFNSTVSVRLSLLGGLLATANKFQVDPVSFGVYLQAGSFLIIAPPLLLYLIFQRQFTESIENSGIVG
jgi:multiple sugar transport system permease protein